MRAWSINYQLRRPLLLIACIEAAILFSSIYVADIIVCGSLEECVRVLGPIVPKASLVAIILLLSLVAMGLYQFHQRFYFREAVLRLLVGLGVGCLVLAIIFSAFPSMTISRNIAIIAIGYALLLLILSRYLIVHRIDDAFRRRTLVYGAGERAASLFDLRRRSDRRGFIFVGRVTAPGDTITGERDVLITNGQSIADIAAEKNADEIVVAMDNRRGNLPIRDLLNARLAGVDVIDLLEFLERETGKIRIDLVSPGWLIFSPGFKVSRSRRVMKRAVDILVSSVILLLSWPIMLMIMLAITIEDGPAAPVLYRQFRVGQGSKRFQMLKFRSMNVNAEPEGKAQWARSDDSRVTNVGRFLRVSRLDELPQVINVLRGQMSLVGPRPERPEFVEELKDEIPYYAERHTVKPGVTGWAQVRYGYGASRHDAIEKLQYDLYYIKNQTLMLDIMIILHTVEIVLWGKGAR